MSKETTSRSADKLAAAIGLIKEEYIEEAHAETVQPEENPSGAAKETDNQPLKWKRITRRAGILIAAAAVVIIVAAVILLPGGQGGGAAKTEMAAAPAAEAEAAAEEAAPAEAAAEDGADMAYEMAEDEAVQEYEEAMAVNDMQAAGGAVQMESDNKGCAVKYNHVLVLPVEDPKESVYEYPDGYEPATGIIIESADQLADYLQRASLETTGTVTFAGKSGKSLQEVFDDNFFKKQNLALTFVEVNSGSYQVNYLSTEEKDGTALVSYNVYRPDQDPEKEAIITADMADWMLLSAVSKDVRQTTAKEEAYPYR